MGVNMNLRLIGNVTKVESVSATVDVQETGGRYAVTLSKNSNRGYFVAITNFNIAIEVSSYHHCFDKLVEKGLSSPDARAVVAIIDEYLKPQLR
jgi:hypothetical protein